MFILLFNLQSDTNVIVQMVPALAMGSSFRFTSVSFQRVPICSFFLVLSIFLLFGTIQCSRLNWYFAFSPWNQPLIKGSLVFFYWILVFRNQYLVLGVLIAIGLSVSLGLLIRQE